MLVRQADLPHRGFLRQSDHLTRLSTQASYVVWAGYAARAPEHVAPQPRRAEAESKRFSLAALCDRAVETGLLLLLLLTPVAFGTVHPWAYIAMEEAVGVLAILWIVRLIGAKPNQPRRPAIGSGGGATRGVRRTDWSAAFASLPPAAIRLVSPSTYEIYARSLPGWPERWVPQTRATVSMPVRAVILPTEREVREGAPIPSFEAAR